MRTKAEVACFHEVVIHLHRSQQAVCIKESSYTHLIMALPTYGATHPLPGPLSTCIPSIVHSSKTCESVTAMDVVYAPECQGRTPYGFGGSASRPSIAQGTLRC